MNRWTALQQLDLNLLVAFDVLMTECNVTRSAERLMIGQPAMSHALSRLRYFFGDPLLVREGRNMIPTTRALSLVEPIRAALDGIDTTIRRSEQFDPHVEHRTFTLMASDYVLLVLLGPLVADLQTEAPNVRLQITPVAGDFEEQLVTGRTDLLIFPDELGPTNDHVHAETLWSDEIVCAVDRAHPDVGDRLTDIQLATLPCVSFGGKSDTTITSRFRSLGIDRDFEIATQSFVIQPLILTGTRLMALVPERLGTYFAQIHPIRLVPLPRPVEPMTEMLYWSPRSDADPAHRWLRERVLRAANGLDAPASHASTPSMAGIADHH